MTRSLDTAIIAAMSEAPGSRPPNIVLIIMDDLAWGDLACHGNPHVWTPHLDRLHAQSTRLTNYCSGPVSTPARASIMTGRYPYRTRAIDTYCGRSTIDPGEITLAQMLKAAGYRTCLSGKWHLGDTYPSRPIDMGFDEALYHHGGGLRQPGNLEHFHDGDSYFNPLLNHNGTFKRVEGYCTDIFADHAVNFIAQSRDEPFFVYFATNAPHCPFEIGEEWWSRYAGDLPERWARVYGMVENIDHNVGKVLDKLDELHLAADTIVIYTSDHGPCGSAMVDGHNRWNGDLRGQKTNVYEGGVKAPHFWRWPGRIEAGRDIAAIANPIDVPPTLAAIADVELPRDRKIDGVDLSPLLFGRTGASDWPDRQIFTQWHRGDTPVPYRNCSVRTQRWKLVDGRELYDMPADPSEQHDVSAEHPGVVNELRQAYDSWLADVSHSRGDNFAAPPIAIGNVAAPRVPLTRQDWRVHGTDGWSDEHVGGWRIRVERELTCTIEVEVAPAEADAKLILQTPGGAHVANLGAGTERHRFESVQLPAGRGWIEAWLDAGDTQTSARYVNIQTE